MSRAHLWAVPSLLLLAAAASSDAKGQVAETLLPTLGGVQATMGSGSAEAWTSASTGAKFTNVEYKAANAQGRQVTMKRPGAATLQATTLRGPIAGSSAAAFDTDLAPGVTRIVFEPSKVEIVEYQDGEDRILRHRPGRVDLGTVAFTMTPVSRTIADWVHAALLGTPNLSRRDVTVTVKSTAGAALRIVSFKRCLPKSYVSSGSSAVLELEAEGVAFSGASHPVAFEWANSALAEQSTARDTKLQFLGSGGRGASLTATLARSLVSGVGLSALDRSSTEPVTEWISLQADRLDPMP